MSGDYANVPAESDADRLFRVLKQKEAGKPVFISSEDPIGIYNHVVRQFNAKCNRVAEGSFEKIDNNCFYALWMKRFWTLLEADTNVLYMIFSFLITFLIGFIPIINLALLAIWLLLWFLYERLLKQHKLNMGLCEDPFKYMVYAPEVCKRAKLMNVYFDLPVSEIGQVGLRESQISFLRSRALDGKVVFMVYNSRFKNAYTKLTFLRIFHIIQVVVAIVSLLIANLAMYPAMDINEFML